MEYCVATRNGRILSARPDGASWGSGEAFSSFVAAGLEPEQWRNRLVLIKCPEMTELDGYRYHKGTIDFSGFDITDTDLELSRVDFTSAALTAAESEEEYP